jgi:DNA replication licensing factor MCM7
MQQTEYRRSAREQQYVYTAARTTIQKYGSHKDMIREFLSQFDSGAASVTSGIHGGLKYMNQLQAIADRQATTLSIDLGDLSAFCKSELVESLVLNAQRYVHFFYEMAAEIMPPRFSGLVDGDAFGERAFAEWRESLHVTAAPSAAASSAAPTVGGASAMPRQFRWNFQVLVRADPGMTTATGDAVLQTQSLRTIRSASVGKLVSFRGIVARVSSVKPRVDVATYHCDRCGGEVFQVVDTEAYTPVLHCPGQTCRTNKVQYSLVLQLRTSKLNAVQEVRVQEPSNEVPAGCVPGSLTVVLEGALCRGVLPGDGVVVTGIYLPIEYAGFKRVVKGGGDMQVLALAVHKVKQKKELTMSGESGSEAQGRVASDVAFVRSLQAASGVASDSMYTLLAKSIAPEIYGMLDVKKALLLQLVGGVTKTQTDGLKMRGDIHLLLVGDPGVAKSQLLKWVGNVAERSVYTTGKGSSGVGLTASVLRDKKTNEVSLEGGALVLADSGICMIDEFDKMEESDRTAIHEVMEQQSVSIAKAGITSQLNARTAVLAAANPVYGRYDRRKSILENINLPAALLSRFDLQFVLLDVVEAEKDSALAKHVGFVHRFGDVPPLDYIPIKVEFIREYIRRAKQYDPVIKDLGVVDEIVQQYVSLRQNERSAPVPTGGFGNKNPFGAGQGSYTTLRTLLGILRMSQALARLRLSEVVDRSDFVEAVRLMAESRESVEHEMRKNGANAGQAGNSVSAVWDCIQSYMKRIGTQAKILDIEKHAQTRGFSSELVRRCLKEYADMDVILLDEEAGNVTIV